MRRSLLGLPFALRSRVPAFFSLALLTGCSGSIAKLPVGSGTTTVSCCRQEADRPVTLQYLGAGGWLIHRGAEAVLTAPFFSNPGLLRVALGRIHPDEGRISRHLPDVSGVEVVLVGHSHYDHLLDLPYLVSRLPQGARIYGDDTMVHTLASAIPREKLLSAIEDAGGPRRPGRWIPAYGGRVRFMPLVSEHAPHYHGIKFFSGHVTRDRPELPSHAADWKEGEPLAFLIDFLDPDGSVDFRIHYQDAASAPPFGFPPDLQALDGRAVDVAILCVASFHEVPDYPEAILRRIAPRHVLLGHWEDFFTSPDKPVRTVRATDVSAFIDRLRVALPPDVRWTLPKPGAVLVFQ